MVEHAGARAGRADGDLRTVVVDDPYNSVEDRDADGAGPRFLVEWCPTAQRHGDGRRGGFGQAVDVVDGRTHGDVADRQGVASLDRRFRAAQDGRTHNQTTRSDHVTTFTVGVAHQSDVSRAVRVVLDAFDLRRDTILVANEVDHTVVMLVTTALVAHGDATVVVTARVLLLGFQQRSFWSALVQVRVHHLDHATTARRGWFNFYDSHDYAASPEKFSS